MKYLSKLPLFLLLLSSCNDVMVTRLRSGSYQLYVADQQNFHQEAIHLCPIGYRISRESNSSGGSTRVSGDGTMQLQQTTYSSYSHNHGTVNTTSTSTTPVNIYMPSSEYRSNARMADITCCSQTEMDARFSNCSIRLPEYCPNRTGCIGRSGHYNVTPYHEL